MARASFSAPTLLGTNLLLVWRFPAKDSRDAELAGSSVLSSLPSGTGTEIHKSFRSTLCYGFPIKVVIFEMALRAPKLYKERAMMSKLCIDSYPSSLYRFEKTLFWPFVLTFCCGEGGPI